MFSGAFGAGKTRALCDKAVKLSLKHPGNRGLLCRKTEVALQATTLRTLLQGDGKLGPALPPDFIARHERTRRTVTLINGSEILYGGLFGENKGWINSLNLGWAAVDQAEELELEDWQLLQGRLRLDVPDVKQRQLFGACNPRHPGHWIYQRFFVEKPAGCKVVVANTNDNPHLPPDYIARLETFTGPFYERFVLGRWVGLEGLVYDNFDPLRHIIDPFPLDPAWRRWRAVDFGYQNPFVCLWACEIGPDAPAPEGALVIYREIYHTRRRVAEHGAHIARLSEGERILATFADHDAAGRAELGAQGVPTTPANKDLLTGLQTVRAWLGEDNQLPRLYFFRDALVERDPRLTTDPVTGGHRRAPACTTDEFSFYRWPQSDDGKPVHEQPVKAHDHGLDALRYLLASLGRAESARFVEAGTPQGSRWRRFSD